MTAQELREKGFRAFVDGDFTESKRYFTLAVHESPSPKETALALVGLANAKIALGEYEGAAADCAKAIEFDQNQWQAYYYLGASSFRMSDLEAARQALSKGLQWPIVDGVAYKFDDLLSEIEAVEILITNVPGDNAPGNNADVEVGDPSNQPWFHIYTKQLSATDATRILSLKKTLLDPLFDVPDRKFPAGLTLPILVQIEDGEPAEQRLHRRPKEYCVYWKKFIADSELKEHRWVEFSYKWRVVSTVETLVLRVSRIPDPIA